MDNTDGMSWLEIQKMIEEERANTSEPKKLASKKKEEPLEDSEKRKEDKIRKQKEENERKRKAKITASESTTNSSEDAMELDGIGTNTSITNIAAIQKKGHQMED